MHIRIFRSPTGIVQAWGRLSTTQRLMARGVGVLAVVVVLAGAVGGWSRRASAADQVAAGEPNTVWSQWQFLRRSLDSVTGELELASLKLQRAQAILDYSVRYQVGADLATLIYDTALREALDPELGFRLIKIESEFNPRAHSTAGAMGLAQVQLRTAQFYLPDITAQQLLDPATNVSVGFRYMRDLLETYGDLGVALLAYNRGPKRIADLIGEGRDPRNGYASSVMKNYPGM